MSREMFEIRQQLERQGRLIRWLTVGWLTSITLFLMGAAYTYSGFYDDLKVRRLALVDANGVERVVLATGHDQVRIGGKIYKRRSPGNGLIFQNAEENEVGGLVMHDDGTLALSLDGLTDQVDIGVVERAGFFVFPDGRSGIRLNDQAGKTRVRIESDPEMNAVIELSGQDQVPRIMGKVSPQGQVTWQSKR